MAVLSAAIMAHPARAAFIPELRAKLDRDVPVVWDEKGDRWDTGSRSLLAYDPRATHHLVLQDDAVIPHDLLAGTERLCAHLGENAALCLYFGRVKRSRVRIWQMVRRTTPDTSWIVMNELHWGVGVVVPTWTIEAMCATAAKYTDLANYDRRLGRWLMRHYIPVYYPWPSLVNHRDSPSLIAGRGQRRHAVQFIGDAASALDFRIGGGTVRAPGVNERRRTSS